MYSFKTAKEHFINLRLPHYAASGAITFGVEYGLFLFFFYVVGLSAIASNTLAYTIALLVNFLLNKHWVFDSKDPTRKLLQPILYLLLAGINLLATNVLIHLLVAHDVPAFIAKLVLIVLVASWNFVIFRKLIFR